MCRSEIGADRRADAVRAMATGARRTGDLAVEDLLAERDLSPGRSRRHRESRRIAGIGMHALRRQRIRRGSAACCFGAGAASMPWRIGIALIGHAPDAAGLVVADVERAVGSDGEARRPVRGARPAPSVVPANPSAKTT